MRELLLNLVILASLIVTTASLAVYVSGPETKIMPETRTAALFSGSELTIPVLHARASGPYSVQGNRTLDVIWSADADVNVYVMDDADWANRLLGTPTTWRAFSYGSRGSVQYRIPYPETLYVQVMTPTWASAKLYTWEETLTWTELVSVNDYETQGQSLMTLIATGLTLIVSVSLQLFFKGGGQDGRGLLYEKV